MYIAWPYAVNNKPITHVAITRRGPPRSQQSDLSNKFSIASTTMTSLDTDSDFDLKFTDVHFSDCSVSGSPGVRSPTNSASATAVLRQSSSNSQQSVSV